MLLLGKARNPGQPMVAREGTQHGSTNPASLTALNGSQTLGYVGGYGLLEDILCLLQVLLLPLRELLESVDGHAEDSLEIGLRQVELLALGIDVIGLVAAAFQLLVGVLRC